MSWVKRLIYERSNNAFLAQLIFGSGQMNDNFMKCTYLIGWIFYRPIKSAIAFKFEKLVVKSVVDKFAYKFADISDVAFKSTVAFKSAVAFKFEKLVVKSSINSPINSPIYPL